MSDFVKVRVLRPCTLHARGYEPGEGPPPTFTTGDVVEVGAIDAQFLVGNGKVEYYTEEAETATAEPAAETATRPRARTRKK